MFYRMKTDPVTKRPYLSSSRRGSDLLLDPFTNKGTAFTIEERDELGLIGLLPPAISTMLQQLERAYENYKTQPTDLARFVHLLSLHDRNEILFYRLVHEHIEEMMPIVYTPTVGEACQKFSHIYRRARGLYVSYDLMDRIPEQLANYHVDNPSVMVVTDGERILGLGDQGAGGMGIPIGKLCLYTLCAGVSPMTTIPVTLDVGTDNEERLEDPLYLGLRRHRIRGEAYQEFVDRFVEAVMAVYPNVLLQWEDFLKENAIKQLARFRDRLCTFNDDIQGTAGVAMAGIFAGLRVTGESLADQRIVIAGAGAAAQGISDLAVSALMEAGLTREEARGRLWTVDSAGLVTRARANLEEYKAAYARSTDELGGYTCRNRDRISLEETIAFARPSILIGTSGKPGLFGERTCRLMGEFHRQPMIFALSNPNSKCECRPEDVLAWTEGRALVATGSPFPPVTRNGRSYRIGQCNNSFLFPGVGLGVWAGGVRRVTEAMFLDGARVLAEFVSKEDLDEGALFPPLGRIRDISHAVACAVIRRGVREGHASSEVLEGLEERVRDDMWFPRYQRIRYEPEGGTEASRSR